MKKILTSTLFCCFTLGSQGQTNLSQGLMAHFPFTGNAGDSSGNNNHGIVSNASLTTDRFGNPFSAYLFDGASSYIRVPYSSSLQTSVYELTICAWVKLKDFTGSPNKEALILEKANGSAGDWSLEYIDTDPNPAVEKLRFSGRVSPNSSSYLTTGSGTSTVPDTGKWYFIATTFDAKPTGKTDYYVDCKPESSFGYGVSGWSFWANSSDLYIGKSGLANDRYFKGIIDDIRIYNRRLTQCEIAKLYSSAKMQLPLADQTVNEYSPGRFIAPEVPCGLGYQWQVDTGTGFLNLASGGPYDKLYDDTLILLGAWKNMNNYKYRCLITGDQQYANRCYFDTTQSARLTVIPTNVQDVETAVGIDVYPNPATDEVNIKASSIIGALSFFNVYGQLVLRQLINSEEGVVDVHNLPNGIYYLQTEQGPKRKILKQ